MFASAGQGTTTRSLQPYVMRALCQFESATFWPGPRVDTILEQTSSTSRKPL
jgi:hypothetical protein